MLLKRLLTISLFLSFSTQAFADQGGHSFSILWMVITGAMIFLMQAGFALLESGLTRAKNSVNVIMKNYADLCVG
ncbi:MAG: ammonium transporter, partial [Pseudomonadota bacterium]|nr:ammonium transporter [Pseudomonadota bacterium]